MSVSDWQPRGTGLKQWSQGPRMRTCCRGWEEKMLLNPESPNPLTKGNTSTKQFLQPFYRCVIKNLLFKICFSNLLGSPQSRQRHCWAGNAQQTASRVGLGSAARAGGQPWGGSRQNAACGLPAWCAGADPRQRHKPFDFKSPKICLHPSTPHLLLCDSHGAPHALIAHPAVTPLRRAVA